MKFTSHSQAGQDLAAFTMLGGITNGFFVDVGCSHPIELSNTYALERLGWLGVMLDSSESCCELCRMKRRAPVICADATQFDWSMVRLPEIVSYASIDVDEHTHAALLRLLESGSRFRVVTCEHDHYQRDDRLRLPNREALKRAGYELLAADVHSNGCCFEDWFVAPDLVDMARVEPFRSTGFDWADVLRKGGAL